MLLQDYSSDDYDEDEYIEDDDEEDFDEEEAEFTDEDDYADEDEDENWGKGERGTGYGVCHGGVWVAYMHACVRASRTQPTVLQCS